MFMAFVVGLNISVMLLWEDEVFPPCPCLISLVRMCESLGGQSSICKRTHSVVSNGKQASLNNLIIMGCSDWLGVAGFLLDRAEARLLYIYIEMYKSADVQSKLFSV